MKKTILVVYISKAVYGERTDFTDKEIRGMKKYTFNTESDVKEGDLLKSDSYKDNMFVVTVIDKSFNYYNSSTGEFRDDINSSMCNKIAELVIIDKKKEDVIEAIIINKEEV